MYKLSFNSTLFVWRPTARNVTMKNLAKLTGDTSIGTLRKQRDSKIKAEYARLYADGKRTDWILSDMSARFYLAKITIEQIVFERGHYRLNASVPASSAGARA